MALRNTELPALVTLLGLGCAGGSEGAGGADETGGTDLVEESVRWVDPTDGGVRLYGILEVVENQQTEGTLVAAWSIHPVDHAVLSLLLDDGVEACGVSGDFERGRPLDAELSVRVDDMTWDLYQLASGFWKWDDQELYGLAGRTVEPGASGSTIVVPAALNVTDLPPRVTTDGTTVRLKWDPVGDGSRINATIQVGGRQVRCILDDDGSALIEGPVFEDEPHSVAIGATAGAVWRLAGDSEWIVVGRVEGFAL